MKLFSYFQCVVFGGFFGTLLNQLIIGRDTEIFK